jgi:hypothetical protein
MAETRLDKKKNVFSVPEACSIIEACAKNGVSFVKFGDLCVRFKDTANIKSEDPSLAQPTPSAEEIAALQKSLADASFLEDEIDLRAQQIADLIIEDPGQAEQMIMDGELEDADELDDGSIG